MLLERRADEVLVRIEHGRGRSKGDVGEPLDLDGQRDGVAMNAQLGGDGADLPVLGVEQPPDAGAQLRGDHRAPRR